MRLKQGSQGVLPLDPVPAVTEEEEWFVGHRPPHDLGLDLSLCYPDPTSNAVKTSFSQIALIKILLLFIIILCFMSYLFALSNISTINHFDKFFSYYKIKVWISLWCHE